MDATVARWASIGAHVGADMPLPCTSTSGSPAPHSSTRTVSAGSASRTNRLSAATPYSASSVRSASSNAPASR